VWNDFWRVASANHRIGRLCAHSGLLFFFGTLSVVAADSKLVIDVLRGAHANNNVVSGTSVSPVIQVRDGSGKPVPDALVVFAAPGAGPSVNFAGQGAIAQSVSDESGTAIAPHFVPTGDDGPVEIRIMVTKDGVSANLSVFQMNLGVHDASAPPDELDLSGFAEVSTAERKGKAPRIFQVFVTTRPDTPLPGASVHFSVRTERNPGKWDELDPLQTVSGSDGEASATMNRKSGGAPLEFSVKAVFDGRTATRYFILER
jgi:hypothetical protein